MKILAVEWFTQPQFPNTLGIVVIETETGGRKAYIGHGFGENETIDAQYIAENGGKVYSASLKKILETLGDKEVL